MYQLKNVFMKRLLFSAILLISTIMAHGRVISGIITDYFNGEPLIGAMIMNGDRGTVTDLDGRYQIEAQTGDKLIYQYVGYLSEKRTVGSNSKINVILSKTTGDEILDAFTKNENLTELEKIIKSQYGIDVSLSIDVDTYKKEIIYIYEYFDKTLFDSYDLDGGMNGCANGIITSLMQTDPSGSELELLVDRFETNKYNLRLIVKYKNQSKSGLITFKDLRIKANATLGK